MNKALRQSTKNKIAKMKRVMIAQMCSIDNSKNMTNSTFDIYRTIIHLEVSDEMTRAFKKNLKLFKSHRR